MARRYTIPEAIWDSYIADLRRINDTAADAMLQYLQTHPWYESASAREAAIDYAYALATKYGEAAAAYACDMFQAAQELTMAFVDYDTGILQPIEPAPTATYDEVAKAVRGTMKTGNANVIAGAVGRMVKLAGVDTTMQNAIRHGYEWAWVPRGETCAFCIMLASNGWQRASQKAMRNGHAQHVHANCDCTYAVRGSSGIDVSGYDPDRYAKMYYDAEGSKWKDKLNSMRRAAYAENKETGLLALDSSIAEEIDVL